MAKIGTSEVHSYRYILNELETKKGWKHNKIYTQKECLDHPEIKKYFELKAPENVVEINPTTYYIVEAKNERNKIDIALSEAREYYADRLNKSKKIQAIFVTGIAGNKEEGYIAKSQFYYNNVWHVITENNIEITSLLSKSQIDKILSNNNPNIQDLEITEEEFLRTAEDINENLHKNSINKDYRARFISAILLAMSDGQDIDVSKNTTELIAIINTRVNSILKRHNKIEFARFIKIDEPSNEDNHSKIKDAIVYTYQELLGLNIRSAMNSGKDILGKFYEVFLKYGNGAKEIGIVLTPRHITRFAASILDINSHDFVLDPACGTGGFLVAAFDEVRRKNPTQKEFDNFKNNGLYGIEEQDPIISLAIVNMIFRGDGKNNMVEGDCFKKYLNLTEKNNLVFAEFLSEESSDRQRPITKVLMNPPFAKPESKLKEYRFIESALNQMTDEGLLFSVLPTSNMVKQGKYLNWRKNILLKSNTLICVITFPNDLFYPIGVETCGIVVKKGIPHDYKKNVLWVKIKNDGLLKTKGRRLPNKRAQNDFDRVTDTIKYFINDPTIQIDNIPEFQKACPIEKEDKNLELLPEVYLDEKTPSPEELKSRIDFIIRDTISHMIKNDKINDFKKENLNKEFFNLPKKQNMVSFEEVAITELFKSPIKTGPYHVSGILDNGLTPLVSCVSENGGFEGLFEIDIKNIVKNAITIASDGMPLTSFYHYYHFTAKDNVLICYPDKKYRFTTLLFFVTQLNGLRWRFSYGRKCYENKIHKIKIFLPLHEKKLDEDFIENLFKSLDSWKLLEKLVKEEIVANNQKKK